MKILSPSFCLRRQEQSCKVACEYCLSRTTKNMTQLSSCISERWVFGKGSVIRRRRSGTTSYQVRILNSNNLVGSPSLSGKPTCALFKYKLPHAAAADATCGVEQSKSASQTRPGAVRPFNAAAAGVAALSPIARVRAEVDSGLGARVTFGVQKAVLARCLQLLRSLSDYHRLHHTGSRGVTVHRSSGILPAC